MLEGGVSWRVNKGMRQAISKEEGERKGKRLLIKHNLEYLEVQDEGKGAKLETGLKGCLENVPSNLMGTSKVYQLQFCSK